MRTVLILLLAALPLIGCGQKSLFPIEPVEGTVTLDGVPLEGATVNFTPANEGDGMSAVGLTNAQGLYKLTAFSGGLPEKGTMVGNYTVTIVLDRRARETTPEDDRILEQGGSIYIPIVHVVPRRYNRLETSGLTAEVVKGKNVFDFDLRSEN